MSSEARLFGRLMSMIGIGRISASTALTGKGVRRAQVRFDESEVRDATPAMGLYGVTSRPLVGADALVVFVGGDRSRGIIIATNDRRHQIEIGEGEVALHSHNGLKVHLTAAGIVIDGGGLPVTFQNTPNVVIPVDATIGGKSFNGHRHVETGGVTQEPI